MFAPGANLLHLLDLNALLLDLLLADEFYQLVPVEDQNAFFVFGFTELVSALPGLALPYLAQLFQQLASRAQIVALVHLSCNVVLDKVLAIDAFLGGALLPSQYSFFYLFEVHLCLLFSLVELVDVLTLQLALALLLPLFLELLLVREHDLHAKLTAIFGKRSLENQVELRELEEVDGAVLTQPAVILRVHTELALVLVRP